MNRIITKGEGKRPAAKKWKCKHHDGSVTYHPTLKAAKAYKFGEKLYPHPFVVLGRKVTKAELDELLAFHEESLRQELEEIRGKIAWYEDPEQHI
jgi:hypothetical protein